VEEKEILSLLCKVHELEIDKVIRSEEADVLSSFDEHIYF
jgi:hypothetical protein